MMVAVEIEGLFLTQSQASGVILKESGGKRSLPIVIGDFEAQSIALGLENIKAPRPITHDLIMNMLEVLDAKIVKIEITALKQNTFYATLHLENSTGLAFEIDSRPSDAIAVAIRVDAPIFVEESVLSQGGYSPDKTQYFSATKKQPKKESTEDSLEALEKKLENAIQAENYELAAEIKEKIRQLKANS
jgi:bifunctional DNase/RNase